MLGVVWLWSSGRGKFAGRDGSCHRVFLCSWSGNIVVYIREGLTLQKGTFRHSIRGPQCR
jgi:hypothetical protein